MSLRTHNTWDNNAIYLPLKENRKIYTYIKTYIHTNVFTVIAFQEQLAYAIGM